VYSLAAGTPQEPLNKVVAVKSIAGKTASSYFGWTASVTVTIRDVNTGANVSNAMVKGSFSTGGSVSCTTSSVGSCSLASGTINRKSLSTTLSITDVSGTGMTYDASQNSATQIVISKP